jgi:hypothetical protein
MVEPQNENLQSSRRRRRKDNIKKESSAYKEHDFLYRRLDKKKETGIRIEKTITIYC